MYPDGIIITVTGTTGTKALAVTDKQHMYAIVTKTGVYMKWKGTARLISGYQTSLASQTEIDTLLAGKPMPAWVGMLQANAAPVKGQVKVEVPTDGGWVHQYPAIPAPKDPNAGRATLQMFQQTCVHSFKTYTGFSQIFRYCIFCDKKENE